MKEEIIKRLAQLLVKGYTRGELVLKLLSGEITTKPLTENLANKWVDEAEKLLDIDIGQDAKLNYARLLHIYQGCLEKRDYSNALKAWKEIKEFKGGVQDKEITIKFIK